MDYNKNMLLRLLLLVGAFNELAGAEPEFTEPMVNLSNLKAVAEVQGFGYKTANLLMLKDVCTRFNAKQPSEDAQLAVPEFIGIPSQNIQAKLLNLEDYFDLEKRWQAVVGSKSATELDAIFATKQFPQDFLNGRSILENDLHAAWQRVASSNIGSLDAFFAIKGLDALLAEVSERGNRLMVRSTGKEDTKEFANAGGNASVANVEPTAKAVLEAMGEVVVSYFGKKSLSQRLGLGDLSIFDPKPFTPVLVQEMVGEKEGEPVPACGVMFTEEPEGGIAHKNILNADRRGTKTTGITLIQGAYGHNEGVVNSLIPVDTYYVVSSELISNSPIYSVIRPKIARMVPNDDAATPVAAVVAVGGAGGDAAVPVAAAKLKQIKNSGPLVTSQALSKKQLLALKGFAQELEQFYGYPMDVEFVAKGNTIFIVQARPIVYKKGGQSPSYLVFEKGFTGKKFNGSTIGAAGGSIRDIHEADELIVAPTIGVALNMYLQPGFNKTKVKAVLVGAMAPSTSHEATTFRNEGLPVMFLPDWDKVVGAIPERGFLIVSPQQNMVAVMAEGVNAVEGWCSYPIPRALSVFVEDGRIIENIKITWEPRSQKELLAIMKTGDSVSVAHAVYEILSRCNSLVRQYPVEESLQDDVNALSQKIFFLGTHILNLAKISQGDDLYLLRLLPIRMLEALLFQQISREEVVNPVSMATLGKVLQEEALISDPIANKAAAGGAGVAAAVVEAPVVFVNETMRPYYNQLRKLDKNIFVDEVRADWDWLLRKAAGNKLLMRGIVNLVKNLHDVSLLPTWLHSDFATSIRILDKASATPASINALVAGWKQKLEQDKDFLAVLKEKMHDLKALNGGAFGVASSCKIAWQDFKDRFIDYFAGEEFTRAFAVAGPYARQAAVKIMHEMITAFDEAIKSVKGNPDLPNVEKLPLFQKMLQENFRMLQAWVALVPRAKKGMLDPLEAGVPMAGALSTRAAYFEMMENLVNKLPFTDSDLLLTEGVSTFIFSIGSGYNWYGERSNSPQPKTGEDVFSIMHQSLLNCCVILAPKKDSFCPGIVARLEEVIKLSANSIGWKKLNLASLGSNVSHNAMTLYYNIPLNNHSCQIQLQYAHKKEQASVTMHFCGGLPAERFRWCNIAGLGLLAGMASAGTLLKTNITILSNHLLSMNIQVLEKSKEAVDLFATLLKDSLCLSLSDQSLNYALYNSCTPEGFTQIIKTLNAFNEHNIGLEASLLLMEKPMFKKFVQNENIKLCVRAAIGSKDRYLMVRALQPLSNFVKADQSLNAEATEFLNIILASPSAFAPSTICLARELQELIAEQSR